MTVGYAVVAGALLPLAAAAPSAVADNGFLQVFLQYGALGGFAIISVLFFNRVYKRETERADKAEQALADLNRDIRDKVVPVLIAATQAVSDVTTLVKERR